MVLTAQSPGVGHSPRFWGSTPEAKLQAILAKIPTPVPTGSAEKDSDAQAKHNIRLKMIGVSVVDSTYSLPMYQAFQEHEKNLAANRTIAAFIGEKFASISTFGRLDEGFLIAYIPQNSDLTPGNLGAAAKQNADALVELFEFDTQLLPQLKMPPPLQFAAASSPNAARTTSDPCSRSRKRAASAAPAH